MPRLPSAIRRAAPNVDHWVQQVDQEGAHTRALMWLEWRRAVDERARQPERQIAPVEPARPWWADLPPVLPPEPSPEPFHDGYDFDEEEDEVEELPEFSQHLPFPRQGHVSDT